MRGQYGFDSSALKEIKDSNRHINVPYGEAFLTYVGSDESIYIEHNEPFTESELSSILADIINRFRQIISPEVVDTTER